MSESAYRRQFIDALGFGLDRFQLDAIDRVDQGVNVLVSAPTGSGKTLVATYAIGRELEQGRRTFYTTPLKALSNQKFHELGGRYGASRVGLLTGDATINRDAPVVVMTTEVLRNMLLTDSSQLRNLGVVILDEVHFLQDPFRGGVWEEVLILTPPTVKFIALSATVGNAEFLGEWLGEIRGSTAVIVEQERPIELRRHLAVVRRGQAHAELHELLDGERLSSEVRRIDNLTKASRKFRPSGRTHGSPGARPPAPFRSPRRSELMHTLELEDLLPAIFFIFSRAACDDAVHQLRRDGLIFTTPERRREIESIAASRLIDFSESDLVALEYAEFFDVLRRGIAMHHAGMVPAFREIVEACFERNLLAAVFATETLALGVNMPARSVVLERFTKYSDAGRQFLTSGEFTQLTGRAGRRGLDDQGHAVICFTPDLEVHDVARVALAAPPDLHSTFRPTYNLTANLINRFDYETAVAVIQRSFAQFERSRRPQGTRRSLADQMVARHHVLEELNYARGWALTPAGHLLHSLYHESDLLIAETISSGLLDDLDVSQFAGMLSCFVYESKRSGRPTHAAARVSTKKKRVHHDRLGLDRKRNLADRFHEVELRAAQIRAIEDCYGVPHFREPHGGFSTVIAAWARGVTLSTALDLADAQLGQTSPGDFVRNAKQVADLCEQLGRLNGLRALAEMAREAREAVLRSVVAAASSVHPSRESGI